MAEIDTSVAVWWAAMSLIGIINIGLWWWMARHLKKSSLEPHERLQLILCGIYVVGCASRCFILRSDVLRFAMFDSWASTVLVGRSIATLAEVSFAGQWALFLWWLAQRTGRREARPFAYPLVPLLVTAQCCAWYGVLTTNYIGHTIEESLWAFAAGLFLAGMLLCWPKADDAVKPLLKAGITACVGYILFMLTVDVPNYFRLWKADEAANKVYLTLDQGLRDIQDMTLTGRYEDWRYPMVWMTLYFSVAVWISLAMVWAPYRLERAKEVGSDGN